MIESQHEQDFGAFVADRPSFLTTHKAVAACTREFERLTDGVARGVSALRGTVEETPTVRTSPGRCIVQVGPVALTITWLRSTLDSVAEGQLLAIVWKGTVATRGEMTAARIPARPASAPAVAVWEEAFVADAADEASWRWAAQAADGAAATSTELAERFVVQLREAYAAASGSP